MGNCCGKPFSSSNFAGEGRTLGSAPAPQPTNPQPSSQPSNAPLPPKIASVGKALGGLSSNSGGDSNGARSAAARAAEARASQSNAPSKGKLGQKLQEERKQTRTDTLGQVSAEERRRRDAADNEEARNWN